MTKIIIKNNALLKQGSAKAEINLGAHAKLFKILFATLSCTSSYARYDIPKVDFLESVLYSAQQGCQTALTPAHITGWKIFKPFYDTHVIKNFAYSRHLRIPKIIHHIWLGSKLPAKFAQYRDTWKKLHPTWTLILWDDAAVAQLKLVNSKAYNNATNFAEKADIARYEILYRFGGLYVDTDFESLQPFDVLHHCCDFYTGSYPNPSGGSLYVLNGLIGSAPKHPILKRCIKGIKNTASLSNSAAAIINRTGPDYFYRCIVEALAAQDAVKKMVVFPPTFFYPWSSALRGNKDRDVIMSFVRPESFAVHHWATSWTNDFD